MSTTPSVTQFLAEPSVEEDDFEEQEGLVSTGTLPGATITGTSLFISSGGSMTIAPAKPDPLTSIAESLRTIAGALGTDQERVSADSELEERYSRLDQEYADLEDKNRSLYELLADVEKIVAKSTSKVSLDVKAAISTWRNPVVEAKAPSAGVVVGEKPEGPVEPAVQCPACARYFVDQDLLDRHDCTAGGVPAVDAPLEVWREYAVGRGVTDAGQMNRSQIRTALGLPHFSQGGE